MIIDIGSDRPSFRRLRFREGLNIVLAERSGQSTSGDHRTRNGAGKSSLVDVIRFVLGGDVRKGRDVLAAPELGHDTLDVTFTIGGTRISAMRNITEKARIEIICDDLSIFPIAPNVGDDNVVWFTARTWSDVLGQLLFALPNADTLEPNTNLSTSSCLAFFTRRARDGGYMNWVQTHHAQKLARQAIPLFHLLGLDYSAPLEYLRLDEAKSLAAELRRAVQKGYLTDMFGSRSSLRNELVRARKRRDRLAGRIDGTSVLQFYGAYEYEATELDQKVRELANENFIDRTLIARCERAIAQEKAPETPDLERLYKEAGVHLGESVSKRFDEVSRFHETVVRNRKAHLESEIEAAQVRISRRNTDLDAGTRRLDEIRSLLSGSIGLGDYRKIERELSSIESEIQSLETKLELVDKFEEARTDMKVRQVNAERLLRNTLHEQEDEVLESISVFQEISSHIYNSPAQFDIERTDSGPRFVIHEPSIASEGINNMQIFTFDLMLSIMAARGNRWPGFLVHDSHLFDGVDGRQIGLALEIASEKIATIGGQYIVTMNSDDYEKAMRESGLNFDDRIVEPRLNDSETGGLFGFRFERDTEIGDGL